MGGGGSRCDLRQVGEPAGVVLVDQAVERIVHGLFPHAAVQLVLLPLALQDPHLRSHMFVNMFRNMRGLQWQGSDKLSLHESNQEKWALGDPQNPGLEAHLEKVLVVTVPHGAHRDGICRRLARLCAECEGHQALQSQTSVCAHAR